jgi:hypothetical protein
MYKKRTDKSQSTIVSELREAGIPVIVMSSAGDDFPDILTDWHQWVLIEIKEADGSLSRGQMRFIAKASGFVGVATDFETAKNIAKWPNDYALSEKAKDRITEWLVRNPGQESMRIKKFMEMVSK